VSWTTIEISKCLQKIKISRANKVNTSDFKTIGKYPIIDQGQDYIAGYSNDESKLFGDVPVVIFGDHTRCFKYVPFPFVIGADGTKILKPDPNIFDTKFFYFQCISLSLPNRGYNRHFKLLKEKLLVCPPLPEQKAIAHILSQIQSAIEAQEKIIQTTTELKKALMNELFTKGLRRENQKETEIGLIPESWSVTSIESLIKETETRNPSENSTKMIKYVDVSSVSNQSFSIIGHQYVSGAEAPGRARKVIYENDVIFATIRPSLKRIAKIEKEYHDEYCSTAFCVLRADEAKLNYEYLYQYLLTDNFIQRITKLQSGASYPAVTDKNVKELKIPIPSFDEQTEIGHILKQIDNKLEISKIKMSSLNNLFQTTLHELMIGQINLNNFVQKEV